MTFGSPCYARDTLGGLLYDPMRFDSEAQRLDRDQAPLRKTKPRSASGACKYRHGDSNPGFRRERAAS